MRIEFDAVEECDSFGVSVMVVLNSFGFFILHVFQECIPVFILPIEFFQM